MLFPYLNPGCLEAGCDEAGRGCLAGAVFASAVILPPDFVCEELNASFLAMHRALDKLSVRPQHLLIDGNRFKKYKDRKSFFNRIQKI